MLPLSQFDLRFSVQRLPSVLKERMFKTGDKMFVAGGFIRSCVAREPVMDIDVFCGSKEMAMGEAALCMRPNGRLHETDNAISVHGDHPTLQFIHRWTFQTVEACIASFDFTIAKAAVFYQVDGETGAWKGLCDDQFYPDLAAKRLVYTSPVRNEDAGGSMLRLLKFYQRGYRAPLATIGGVMARMAKGIDFTKCGTEEEMVGNVLTGLLREVDPSLDHQFYEQP